MCGIVGYLKLNGERVEANMIDSMCQTIVHRGPDDAGSFVKDNIGIGMRRLSIIDLETGKQPISNENDSLHIVFNGEIYNYRELKPDLVTKGHTFKTNSDTEVILHLYEEYAEGCLQYLNGMFAFAIWNEKKKELFCARDRLGIKPFYYLLDKNRLIFGSELKVILEEKNLDLGLDLEALSQYLAFEFIPFPGTLMQSIKKLPPGHFLYAGNSGVKIRQYWSAANIEEKERSEEETVEELESLLRDSVRLRLRSDVPFGAFLSGGIDSSSIVGLMTGLLESKPRTFSIGFDDKSYNELGYAAQVAELFGTDHTDQVIEPSAIDLIENLINYMDDPIGDFSIFPTYLVSRLAREKVKVILSGDGGDELFGGYDTYIAQKFYRYYSLIPAHLRKYIILPLANMLPPTGKKKGLINKTKRFVGGASLSEQYDHFRWMIFMRPEENHHIFSDEISDSIDTGSTFSFITKYLDENRLRGINRSMYLDINSYLVDNILVKVDRMSMATSLEARVPFLDHRVVEFALSITDDLKINNFKTKYVLKKMMEKMLPDSVINKPKQGFSIPMKNWLKGPVKPMMTDLLSFDRIKKQGIFNPDYIDGLIRDHLENKNNHSHKLWSLMLLQLWKDRFLT
jgi:asparagine synthase (glutamine-hydrolysing)